MLSPFDAIYLFPFILLFFRRAESHACPLHWKWSKGLQKKIWWKKRIQHWDNLSLVVFQHHLELEQRMQIGLPDERWTYSEMNVVASVSCEHLMRLPMTSLPRFPSGGGLKCNCHRTRSFVVLWWNWLRRTLLFLSMPWFVLEWRSRKWRFVKRHTFRIAVCLFLCRGCYTSNNLHGEYVQFNYCS
jgi:hypothetical protein